MKNNKGQLSTITVLISTFIVVAVVLGCGFIINEQLQEEIGTVQSTVTNETEVFLNDSGYALARNTEDGFNTVGILEFYNATGETITAGNYSVSSDGIITNVTSYIDETETMNISYTYYAGEEGYKGITGVSTSMTTLIDFLPLVVLIVVIGVVLLILFGVLPGGRSSGA